MIYLPFLLHFCTQCKNRMPLLAFSGEFRRCWACRDYQSQYRKRYRKTPKGRSIDKKYRQTEKRRTYSRDYQRTEKAKEKARSYKQKPSYKEWAQQYRQRSEVKDRERIRAQRRLRLHDVQSYYKSYRRSEHGKKIMKVSTQRYKARKAALPVKFTEADWNRALHYFNHTCAVCERSLVGLFHRAAADHWIPIVSPNCPGTVAVNIVPLCQGQQGCNNSKVNRPAKEWLIAKYGARKAKQILKRIDDYFEWVRQQDS